MAGVEDLHDAVRERVKQLRDSHARGIDSRTELERAVAEFDDALLLDAEARKPLPFRVAWLRLLEEVETEFLPPPP